MRNSQKIGQVGRETVIFAPEGNRRIRMHIAQDLDKINHIIEDAMMTREARVKLRVILGELGDYLLDTDIRFAESY